MAKILIVENSKTTSLKLTQLISEAGFEVRVARTGLDAIEQVQAEAFDLVLMDLYMPALNGYEAAKIIRTLPSAAKDIPIIAMTASQEERDKRICQDAGMVDFYSKSAGDTALLQLVQHYLKRC